MSLVGGLLLVQLRRLGMDVEADAGTLKCTAPKGVMTAELKASIATYKVELVELLKAEAEVDRLFREVLQLMEAAAADPIHRDRLEARQAELANGPYFEALEQLIALAGDSWVELVESRSPRPVQPQLIGVR